MSQTPVIGTVTPTVLLTGEPGALRQLVRISVGNVGPPTPVTLAVTGPGTTARLELALPTGDSEQEVTLPEPSEPAELTFALLAGGREVDRRTVAWQPPPHLSVHVVQHSHHDVGYTNLASTVLREHCQFLDDALDLADGTADYPDDARFRLVIEQAWSLQEYARQASPARLERLGELLRRGDFELTALFGNLTTEICGAEELLRALYPSQRLARRFGCAVTTAEHNDVPGLSWGVAQVLTEAGIEFFCPQLPRYWNWCDPPMQTFWDERVLFPTSRPGGFWWQAPSGRRVLLWDCGGTGGDVRPDLPDLAGRLERLVAGGYPYQSVYWLVRGGARDNSPYQGGFCDTVRAWNQRWAWPRLRVSTNAAFWAELSRELPADLPVFAGELPGQDYPVGSASTAAATAANRATQGQLPVAEQLATLADACTALPYPSEALDDAWLDLLWYDEHTWGHHFPAGPTAAAAELEKQVHAYRAAALAHDVTARALARLADHVDLPEDGLHLVVYNPLPQARTAPVATPLRELENAGSQMVLVGDPAAPDQPGYLRGVPLTDRWHLHPSAEITAGRFDLIDLSSGQVVPHQIVPVAADSPAPYAPQREGLAAGGRRYGFFEVARGLARELHFVATALPACGWRTYQLRPRTDLPPDWAAPSGLVIENAYYRVEVDHASGAVTSLIDRELDCELLDRAAPHGLGDLVVRTPDGEQPRPEVSADLGPYGAVYRSLERRFAVCGHPQVTQRLALHEGVKQLELSLRLLKSPAPLLDVHLAFPFAVPSPCFRHDSPLAVETPLDDYLPGAYWDEVAIGRWLQVSGGGRAVLLSSLDAPLMAFGELTAGYTSPAHSSVVPDRYHHAPGTAEQLRHGWAYALLCANNFGTNFAVSQCGSLLFRLVLTSGAPLHDAAAAELGWSQTTPVETIYADRRRAGPLPREHSLLRLDGDTLTLLTAKRAAAGGGWVLRFQNPSGQSARTLVHVGFAAADAARLVAVTEGEPVHTLAELERRDGTSFELRLAPRALATVWLPRNPESE